MENEERCRDLSFAGPVYYKGYYHLFYQNNPFAAVPGTIEWDHAVSKDMIHWQYLGATLIACPESKLGS